MENSFKQRETTSIFECGDRTFEINSFDPMEGNYLLAQILMFTIPFGVSDMLGAELGTEMKAPVSKERKLMSKEEFIQLQTDILSTVYEVYKSGEKSPVVRKNRTYGIDDVSMSLLIKLLVASLAFNFKDFFKESQLLSKFTKD